VAVCDHLQNMNILTFSRASKKPSTGNNTRARTVDNIIEFCDTLVLRKGQRVILTIMEYKGHYYTSISNGMQRSTLKNTPTTEPLHLLLLLLSHSGLAGSQRVLVTEKTLIIHYSAKMFRVIEHVLSITSCTRLWGPRRRMGRLPLLWIFMKFDI